MSNRRLRVALVGGSGFLGRGLRVRLLAGGHHVTVIGRGPSATHEGWQAVSWDARTMGEWVHALEGTDVIVHLAGKRVDCWPTSANIDELIRSREGTVRLVGDALARLDDPPTTWVQLSSLAIFGDAGEQIIDEATPPPSSGPRQQVEVCRRWEAAFEAASADTPRTVLLRPAVGIGSADDPATIQLMRLARLCLGGAVGDGRQWVSWIGADDFFELLHRAVVDDSMTGLYHLTAPEPIRNGELMAAYRDAVARVFAISTPRPLTTVGAWLMGSDPALALTGRRCVPTRLLDEGYRFQTTDIHQAVNQAVDEAY